MSADSFPQDVLELQALLGPVREGQVASGGAGLGAEGTRSGSSGRASSARSLPPSWVSAYSCASHFMPGALMPALETYRASFKPSAQLDRPCAMAGVNVCAAETDAEARRLFTIRAAADYQPAARHARAGCHRRSTTSSATGHRRRRPRSRRGSRVRSSARAQRCVKASRSSSRRTRVDEAIIASAIYEHAARIRSMRDCLGGVPADGLNVAGSATAWHSMAVAGPGLHSRACRPGSAERRCQANADPAPYFLRASASASHPRLSAASGTFDRYGLMSRTGVPSSMSTPRTCSIRPSRRRSWTTVRPIGFGRCGGARGEDAVRPIVARRMRHQARSLRAIEDPEHVQMREAVDVVKAALELRQDVERPLRPRVCAAALGNCGGVGKRRVDNADWREREHRKGRAVSA